MEPHTAHTVSVSDACSTSYSEYITQHFAHQYAA